MKLSKRPKVLLLTPYFDSEILKGIADHSFEAGWNLDTKIRRKWEVPGHWEGQGVITGYAKGLEDLSSFISQHDELPMVCVDLEESGIQNSVVQNSELAGKIAYQHLKSQGYQNFHYVHDRDDGYSMARKSAFEKAVHDDGEMVECTYIDTLRLDEGVVLSQVAKAFADRSVPTGVLCATDACAAWLIEVCLGLGFHVPNELGIVGVDNDPIDAELAMIPITSVDNDRYLHGYRAAEVLGVLMAGGDVSKLEHVISPKGLVVRRSSRRIQQPPEMVVRAKVLIAHHFSDSAFRANDVAERLHVSRRRLHELFMAHHGQSIASMITRYRVEKAKHLIASTEMSLRQIAHASGFSGPEYLSRVFRKEKGRTPSSYRL